MESHTQLVLAFLVLAAVSMSAQTTSGTVGLAGAWEGQLLLGSNWRFMEARFRTINGQPDARSTCHRNDANFVTSARQATGSSGRWFADRTGSALTVPGVATSFVAVPIRADCRASFSSCGSIARFRGETWSWQVHTARPGATSLRSRVTTSVTASAASRSWTCASGYWGTLLPTDSDRYVFAPARSGRFP